MPLGVASLDPRVLTLNTRHILILLKQNLMQMQPSPCPMMHQIKYDSIWRNGQNILVFESMNQLPHRAGPHFEKHLKTAKELKSTKRILATELSPPPPPPPPPPPLDFMDTKKIK